MGQHNNKKRKPVHTTTTTKMPTNKAAFTTIHSHPIQSIYESSKYISQTKRFKYAKTHSNGFLTKNDRTKKKKRKLFHQSKTKYADRSHFRCAVELKGNGFKWYLTWVSRQNLRIQCTHCCCCCCCCFWCTAHYIYIRRTYERQREIWHDIQP